MHFTISAPVAMVLTASLFALASVAPAAAEDGVAADQIVFGQAAVLEGAASALGEQRLPSLGWSAKSYRGTISNFSAGMVWTAFLSSFKCEETISGGSRRIHWLREKSKTSLALNISRNTRSVSPVFST